KGRKTQTPDAHGEHGGAGNDEARKQVVAKAWRLH
ncbi:MAG: hypothetical protein QOE73_1516, partial [Verrucomicrobiota bacterium]